MYPTPPEATQIELLMGQIAFVTSPAKYTAAVTGIGGGKSLTGCMKALIRYKETPGSLNLIGAPTYPTLRDTTQRTFFQLLPHHWIRSFNKVQNHLILKNGAEVLFRSLHNYDFLRGLNLASAYFDEAALAEARAWQVIKGRLRQKGFDPIAWLTTTPRGKNWVYQEFVEQASDTHALVHWSGRENTHLPPNFYQELGYTGNFALQEIEGDFVAFEGLVYRVDSNHCVEYPATTLWREVIGGIDWGYSNPAVALPIGVDGDGRVAVLDECYQRQLRSDDFFARIVELTRRYQVTQWYAGPDEPEHIRSLQDLFDEKGLACTVSPADNRITPGIEAVRQRLALQGDGRPRLTFSPLCINLKAEFSSYQYGTKEASERNSDEKPLKQFDHACDSLRYGIFSHFKHDRASVAFAGATMGPDRATTLAPDEHAPDYARQAQLARLIQQLGDLS